MKRNGFYLVDLLITMILMVGLLSMCAVWTGKTMKYSAKVRQRAAHQRAISQTNSIRRMVQYSDSIRLDGQVLNLEREAGSITVEIAGNELQIVDATGKKQRRETIPFADGAVLSWKADEMPQWVTLHVDRNFESKATTNLRLRMGPMLSVLKEGDR